MVTTINTSKSCNIINKAIAVTGKEMATGKRTQFSGPKDIIVGDIYKTQHLTYKRADAGLRSSVQLLNQASIAINEMSGILKEMQNLFLSASTQNMSAAQLATMDSAFQSQIQQLEQIANSTTYANLSLLNGTNASPLAINLPGGNSLDINIANMTNKASPVGNPGASDLQINFPCTLAQFNAAINKPVGAPVDVLANIKTFSGASSLLYVVANQINEGFNAGLAAAPGDESAACVAYLQAVNWNNLLTPDQALAAVMLMGNEGFLANDGVSRISAGINVLAMGGNTQDAELLIAVLAAIELLPAEYVTQQSPALSIGSSDYFTAVAERLQSASYYFASAQSGVCAQIQYIEGLRNIYNTYSDEYGDTANRYSEVDIVDSSRRLAELTSSYDFAMSATTGFKSRLEQTLAASYKQILQRATS